MNRSFEQRIAVSLLLVAILMNNVHPLREVLLSLFGWHAGLHKRIRLSPITSRLVVTNSEVNSTSLIKYTRIHSLFYLQRTSNYCWTSRNGVGVCRCWWSEKYHLLISTEPLSWDIFLLHQFVNRNHLRGYKDSLYLYCTVKNNCCTKKIIKCSHVDIQTIQLGSYRRFFDLFC